MMTLNELQERVDSWIKQHGVRYFNELTNLSVLMEEVGEFSRLMARIHGEQSFKPGKQPEDVKAALGDEMADILFVLTCLANQMDIDLEKAVERNLQKKTNRDSRRHHENKNLH
jgi:NTP pyrophosphatase (non-canonical NTP hydrolase)